MNSQLALWTSSCQNLPALEKSQLTLFIQLADNLSNFSQQHPTCCNRVAKHMQHVAPNNVGICCVGMLQSFGRVLSDYWQSSLFHDFCFNFSTLLKQPTIQVDCHLNFMILVSVGAHQLRLATFESFDEWGFCWFIYFTLDLDMGIHVKCNFVHYLREFLYIASHQFFLSHSDILKTIGY